MSHSILPTVLLTRPIVQSQNWAELLKSKFGSEISVVMSPVFEINYLEAVVSDGPFDGVIFTSTHGAYAFDRLTQKPACPVYCVGDKTAQVAQNLGFDSISAGGNVEALAALLAQEGSGKKYLYVRGLHVARDLPQLLSETDIEIVQSVLYEQVPKPLNLNALEVLSSKVQVLIPLFSPRSAELFASNLTDDMKSERIALCFSGAVKAKLDAQKFARIQVCERPNSREMVNLLEMHITDGSA